jgi:hypothetical protein
MNFINTLTPGQWALLGAVPLAVVLLYFLKLRRQRQEVPSTYLWRRTIEDLHVNSLWQRLRRNLLLFLQLLLLLLLALALLRPGWRGADVADQRSILLIDNSASMSATDETPSRLEQAKRRALAVVEQMQSGDVAMVIEFSDAARTQSYTASRRTLRGRIDAIRPTQRATDIREALRAAAGLANPGLTRLADNQIVDEALPATLFIFSDGGFPAVPDFALGNLSPVFVPLGETTTENRALTAFAVDRQAAQPDRLQAFVSVANFGPRPATVQVELFFNQQSLDLVELAVAPGEESSWQFELPALDEGVLQVRLDPPDALASDNVAYAAINRPRPAQVLVVSPGSEVLRAALDTEQVGNIADVTWLLPSALEQLLQQEEAAPAGYDLVIFDRWRPPRLPAANTLFLGVAPPGDTWQTGPPALAPTILDVDRVHPLTQLVDMSYVKIAEARPLAPPPGSHALFDSVVGTLLAVAPRDGFEDVVLGFPLAVDEQGQSVPNTTWPLRPSFPVFMFNVIRYLGGSRGALGGASAAPGQPHTLNLPVEVREIVVIDPRGGEHRLTREDARPFVFSDTHSTGVYEVRSGGDRDLLERLVVNLFDRQESDLRRRPSLDIGHETVAGRTDLRATRGELWKWLVLGATLLLIFEWYVFNRRVFF